MKEARSGSAEEQAPSSGGKGLDHSFAQSDCARHVAWMDSLVAELPVGVVVWEVEPNQDPPALRLLYANRAASLALESDPNPWAGGSRVASSHVATVLEVLRTQRPKTFTEVGAAQIVRFCLVPLDDVRASAVIETFPSLADHSGTLREVIDRYRAVLDETTDGIFIHDGSRILDVNAEMLVLSGFAREEILGLGPLDLLHPTSRDAARESIETRSEEPRHYLALHRDGSAFPVETRVRGCTFEGRPARIVLLRDMRARHRTEAVLRATEERLRILARATNDVIWDVDLSSGVVTFSDGFSQMFGYAPQGRVTDFTWWTEQLHPDDRDRVLESLESFQRSSDDLHADEYRVRRTDGTYADVYARAVLMRNASGTPVRIIGAMMDLSERKQMQARLMLADRMASLGTLAAGVAHEINNPLSYVIANLAIVTASLEQMARDPAVGQERAQEVLRSAVGALREAREGADRVRSIVGDLKTFSRGDEERKTSVDVRRVIESALHMADNEIRHRARVVRDFADVPKVEANESRLGQVFINLLVNAAQAIPEGHIEQNEIRISTRHSPDDRVIVEVSDTGPGIPPEIMGRIFDPFFTRKPVGEGTGLGLSICHGIVTALGGEILVESQVGLGTTFRVVLPPRSATGTTPAFGMAAVPRAPRENDGPPSPRALRGGRILVVDDEPLVGRLVERALGESHHVVAATSAKKAILRIEAGERFDVILCDLMMPEMTGMDFYEQMTQTAPDQADAMVFLTGGAFTQRAREFLKQKPRPVLEKPFDLAALESVIHARLRPID